MLSNQSTSQLLRSLQNTTINSMPPALSATFASLKHFLLNDSPTSQETRSALNLIYMLCFAAQAVLSIILVVILAVLSQTISTGGSGLEATAAQAQTNTVSQIMLFAIMFLLFPSALLVASLWQAKGKFSRSSRSGGINTPEEAKIEEVQNDSLNTRKNMKVASIASTIAVAVILAISVWLCVFAYFISIQFQALLILMALAVMLYFCGFIATGLYAKAVP